MQRMSKKYSTGKKGKNALVIQHLKINVMSGGREETPIHYTIFIPVLIKDHSIKEL